MSLAERSSLKGGNYTQEKFVVLFGLHIVALKIFIVELEQFRLELFRVDHFDQIGID